MDHRGSARGTDGDAVSAFPLLARERECSRIAELLEEGQVVVLVGPVGVGKSALLRALHRMARRRLVPCALVTETVALRDFTAALAIAYPHVPTSGGQRLLRARLRAASGAAPGVLLFDDLRRTGSAFKGAIRSVRGTGLGIVLAADVDQPRDRERVRALGLSHHEIELRPLHGHSMRALFQALVGRRELPFSLTSESFRALVGATGGLPGRAVDFADALMDRNAWSGGRPRVEWLQATSAIRAAERYRQTTERL
jgi:energy-coupling factor transporter ATP-binding protein EcfA2